MTSSGRRPIGYGRSLSVRSRELGLGPASAQMLRRQFAEAYMRGRAEGINVFPLKANRALSAEGIAIALALPHGSPTPQPSRASIKASEQEALEVIAGRPAHTVTVEVAVQWDDPLRLTELLAALDARPEPLALPVGAHLRHRVISVTMTVKARTEKAAQAIATVTLIDEMSRLGLA